MLKHIHFFTWKKIPVFSISNAGIFFLMLFKTFTKKPLFSKAECLSNTYCACSQHALEAHADAFQIKCYQISLIWLLNTDKKWRNLAT